MARRKQEPVLAGGGTAGPVGRQARRRDWSLAKERKFLETLAETCNVTLSAKTVSPTLMASDGSPLSRG